MAAVVRLDYANGAGPTLGSAEGGVKYNREETVAGTTPIPRPTATGTAFSYSKPFRLNVTTADATNISNLRLHTPGAPATGLKLWYRDDATTYQRGNAVAAADSGTDDSTPAGYTVMPTTATVYDAGSYSANSTGGKGDYFSTALGVASTYAGGAGSAIAVPSPLTVTYDEA
jgi:hypothetical protein